MSRTADTPRSQQDFKTRMETLDVDHCDSDGCDVLAVRDSTDGSYKCEYCRGNTTRP